MIGSFKAEWPKLRKRPAVVVICGLLVVGVILFAYVIPYVQYTWPASNFRGDPKLSPAQLKEALYPAVFLQHMLGGFMPLGALMAIILGALTVGSEYGWGTLKTVYTQGPGRLSALAGRLAAMELLLLGLATALFGAAAASSLTIALVDGHAVSWPGVLDIFKAVASGWLILSAFGSLGMALAFVFRQPAVAVGLGIAYLVVIEGLTLRWLGQYASSTFQAIEKAFPGVNATSLIDSFGQALPGPAPKALVDPGQATMVLVLYVGAFAVVCAALVRSRDVT